jgi:hypothetical protein
MLGVVLGNNRSKDMSFYNVPTSGAATQKQAMAEFARRNTPTGVKRNKLTRDELDLLQQEYDGLCYQGDFGKTVHVRWEEFTEADWNVVVVR